MALTVYIKEDTAQKKRQQVKRDRRFFTLMATVGFLAIAFSVWPTIAWQVKTLPRLNSEVKDTPIPKGLVLSEKESLEANVQIVEDGGFSYFSTDYVPQGPRPNQFTITVPKLKVENATVKVDNLNFYTNLSHFPGSALPGEVGNSFITGHSVLPQFADPKNYRAIFTKLSDLEVGDDVFVQMDGNTLHYVVQYAKVVNPKDLSVLSPISQNGKNLTLMSCVPPGTSTKRLVVITSLI